MRYYKRPHYKYTLSEDFTFRVPIYVECNIKDYVYLYSDGTLIIKKGYSWDGASFPAINTKTFIKSSLVHDCLFQLMREGKLSREYKPIADTLLREISIEQGMCKIRAWYVYWAVRLFSDFALKQTIIEI